VIRLSLDGTVQTVPTLKLIDDRREHGVEVQFGRMAPAIPRIEMRAVPGVAVGVGT
jgi:hypothetical protein